jgi:ABC-2 type transport system permease protein
MYAILRKELNSFLSSLIGYIVIAVFLLINGLFLWVFPLEFNIFEFGYAGLDSLFILAPFVFLFLIPAISMRSFSEEKRTGTIELLMTKPLTELQIIAGKYFATVLLLIFTLIPTFIYVYTVHSLGFPPGNLDTGGTWGSYIGLLFLGGSFAAIGLFVSSQTSNQIVAFIISVFLSGFCYFGFDFIYEFRFLGSFGLFIKSLGINEHYVSMSRGVIDTRDVLYFLSFIVIFLLLTKISLERRKW